MSTWSYPFRGTSDIIAGFLIDFPFLTFINKGNGSVEIYFGYQPMNEDEETKCKNIKASRKIWSPFLKGIHKY